MGATARDDIGGEALAELVASSGVKVGAEEIGAIARSLARIKAAAVLLQSSPFDDTGERFFRLLEDDGAGAGA